jgi:peroxidase
MPTFVQVRQACGLRSNYTTIDEMTDVFEPENVELLKAAYKSPADIDFYVGGTLEAFRTVNQTFVGRTFGCVVLANYQNVMGGDAYFYSHKTNPNPFTAAQIAEIDNFTIQKLFCKNSEITTIGSRLWFVQALPSPPYPPINPPVNCADLPDIDLSAWKV